MKKLFLSITFIGASLYSYAQDVEGVEINTNMTFEQVVEKFGQPDEVEIQDADWPEGAKIRYYQYGENELVFSDTDGLIEFSIRNNRFALITNYVEGGIRVGDLLSKIQNINIQGVLEFIENDAEGAYIYHIFSQSDCPLWVWVKDGIIIHMCLSIPM